MIKFSLAENGGGIMINPFLVNAILEMPRVDGCLIKFGHDSHWVEDSFEEVTQKIEEALKK